MTTIEHQYRLLTKWHPRSWRNRHADALLGTLLDVAAAQHRTTLTIQERLAILSLAPLAYLDRLIHPRLRELAASIALTTGTGITLGIVTVSSWAPGGPGQYGSSATRIAGSYDLSPLIAAPWLAALILTVIGKWPAGRWILAASIPLDLALPHLADALAAVSTDRNTLLLLAATAALAALGTPDRHWALTPATIGWALITLTGYATQTPRHDLAWQDSADLWGNIAPPSGTHPHSRSSPLPASQSAASGPLPRRSPSHSRPSQPHSRSARCAPNSTRTDRPSSSQHQTPSSSSSSPSSAADTSA